MSNANKFLIVFICGMVGGSLIGRNDGWMGFAVFLMVAGFGAFISGFAAASVEDTL